MIEPSDTTTAEAVALPKRTLALAVLAPFGAIALMASPLLIEAVRHAAGI